MNIIHHNSARLIFDRRHTASKTSLGTVEIEILCNGERKRISTGVRLFKNEWYDKRGIYVSGRHDSDELNEKLNEQLAKIQNELKEKGDKFSLEILQQRETKKSFLEYMRKKINERNDIVERSKKQAEHVIDVLAEHGKIINFSDVTENNIRDFDNWLREKKYEQITIWGYHKRLRTYVRMAVRDKYVTEYPYQYFTISKGKSKLRRYLTSEQLHNLMTCEIKNERVEKIRDLFVFQCFTGLAYVDLEKTDFKKDIEKRGENYYLIDTRQKSGEVYYMQILPPALEILKKYNFILPIVSNAKYNMYLQDVAEYAGLSKKPTTHMARHTFAVWALNNGVAVEVLAKMLGHSDIKTTQIYAEIVQSSVDEAFNSLRNKLNRT